MGASERRASPKGAGDLRSRRKAGRSGALIEPSRPFPVDRLRSLTDFDEEHFQREGIRAHPPIRGPNGEFFGHEWARWRYDTFDAAVDRRLAARGTPARILDLGCASGARAGTFAAAGHHVTAVDIRDAPGRLPSSAVTFIQADLRTLAASDIGARFDLIHARRVLSFVTLSDVDRLLGFVRQALTLDGFLAVGFFTHDVQPERMTRRAPRVFGFPVPLGHGMTAFPFDEVHGLMHERGLDIVEAFTDGLIEVALLALPHA